jgi:hypothetical protein
VEPIHIIRSSRISAQKDIAKKAGTREIGKIGQEKNLADAQTHEDRFCVPQQQN